MAEPVFRIVIDSHEPSRAEELLASRGHPVERRRLRTGDYEVWLGPHLVLACERKTMRDLQLSIIQHRRKGTEGQRRLFWQIERLDRDRAGVPLLFLVERHHNGIEYETQLPQAWGTLLRLQEDGVRVLPTRDLEESLRALLTAAKRVVRQPQPRSAAARTTVPGTGQVAP